MAAEPTPSSPTPPPPDVTNDKRPNAAVEQRGHWTTPSGQLQSHEHSRWNPAQALPTLELQDGALLERSQPGRC